MPDWNGPLWRVLGYASYEAWIESKAGACPPCESEAWLDDNWQRAMRLDWPMPEPPPYPADDENKETPDAASR